MKVMIVEEILQRVPGADMLVPEHNLIKMGKFRYKITQYPTVTVMEASNDDGQWVTTNYYGKLYVRSEIGIDLFVYEHEYSKTPIMSRLTIEPRKITDIYFTKKGPHLLLNIEGDTIEECKVYIVVDGARSMKMFSTLGDVIDVNYYPQMSAFRTHRNDMAVFTENSMERLLRDYIDDPHTTSSLRIVRVVGPSSEVFSRIPSIGLIEGKFIEITEPKDYHDLTQTIKN